MTARRSATAVPNREALLGQGSAARVAMVGFARRDVDVAELSSESIRARAKKGERNEGGNKQADRSGRKEQQIGTARAIECCERAKGPR